MINASESYVKDLLIDTRDGDWGKGEPEDGLLKYHVIRATDFAATALGDVANVPVRYLPGHTVSRRTLQLHDILIETAGGSPGRPTGRTMLVTERVLEAFDGDVTCASFARFLRPDGAKIDARYLYWFLQSLYQSGMIERFQIQHTGVARFQYTSFASTQKVPQPSLSTQRSIAAVLGALDDKIAANIKLAETLAELISAKYTIASNSSVNVVQLSEIVRTQYGVTTSAHDGEGPRFLRVTDINKKPWITWDSTPSCMVTPGDLAKYRVEAGDILVARMADPGKAAFIDEGDPEAVFASYLVRLRAINPDQSLYIYYFLRSAKYREYAEGAMQGSVQRNMNAKVIVATELPMPSSEVITEFNTAAGILRKSIQAALRENRNLAATRDALLPHLISGKLRVKDAELQQGVL